MSKEEFAKIKDAYNTLREAERRKIIDSLANRKDENGKKLFSKILGASYIKPYLYCGGMGKTDYGKHHLEKTYNLSNWKYIETCYNGEYVLISLQSFDIDPSEHNVHVLFDRIGILLGKPTIDTMQDSGMKISTALTQMETTKWQLPLSGTEIDELIQYIICLVETSL